MFVFDKPVPLDTLSVELIDSSGVRTDLTGSAHGPTGDTEVVTPLPRLAAGEVTVRWRLVGPDGHPITGRVAFTVNAPSPTTSTLSAILAEPTVTPSTFVPPASAAPAGQIESTGFTEPWSTPDTARWLFRMLSYLAIMAVGGIVATTAFVWERAWSHRVLRLVVGYALATTVALAIVQLLVIASDIKAVPPWQAAAGVSAAFDTDAGLAFGVRCVLAAAAGWVLFLMRPADETSRWVAGGVGCLALLGTWAYAGHSQSMRWAMAGIPLDVAHRAAAAAWLGGLGIVGLVAMRDTSTGELVGVVQRFGRLAAIAVAVIVGTGALQAIRLVGSPFRLLAADHGRYLLVKLIALAVMLKVADMNRRRVNRRFQAVSTATPTVLNNLRRAMGTELAVGLSVIAIAAAIVVSLPAVAEERSSASRTSRTPSDPGASPPPTPAPAATNTPPSSMPTTCSIDAALTVGATGADVECLQQALSARSYLTDASSGTFDDATDQAVRDFQAAEALAVDGVVGPVTAAQLGIWSGG